LVGAVGAAEEVGDGPDETDFFAKVVHAHPLSVLVRYSER
jgi:hypothetical protein